MIAQDGGCSSHSPTTPTESEPYSQASSPNDADRSSSTREWQNWNVIVGDPDEHLGLHQTVFDTEPSTIPFPTASQTKPQKQQQKQEEVLAPFHVPKLERFCDIEEWSVAVARVLRVYGLQDFITRHVPPPAVGHPQWRPAGTATVAEWARKRAAANLIIHNSLSSPGVNRLLGVLGLDASEDDPKVTFDTVRRVVLEANVGASDMLIRRFRFAYIGVNPLLHHLTALHYCRKRLRGLVDDGQLLAWALEGLMYMYPFEVEVWCRAVAVGELDWNGLMGVLFHIAEREGLEEVMELPAI